MLTTINLKCSIIITTLGILTFFTDTVNSTTAVKHDFCYHDHEGCGPNTDAWAELCHTGSRQSPINLPLIPPYHYLPWIDLRIMGYRGYAFRLRNNGHSISVNFGLGENDENVGPTSRLFPIPEPVAPRYGVFQRTPLQYKFKSAHFHWGVRDINEGSEHCIADRCASMELHFVHYLAKYETIKDAISSGDKNALAVIGVLIDVSPDYTGDSHNPTIAPVVKNLDKVLYSHHDDFVEVHEALDFTPLFFAEVPPVVYSYKGSLTTTPCNEIVNWYVFRHYAYASHADLMAFRRVKDYHNVTLTENHRPLQARNGRQIIFSKVAPWD